MIKLQFHMFGKWCTVAEVADCDEVYGFMLQYNFSYARIINENGITEIDIPAFNEYKQMWE